jgi:hypothetical protein
MEITWGVIKKSCAFISAVLPAILIVHTTMTASLLSGCATVSKDSTVQTAGETEPERLEKKWGIQIESLRLSAADNLIDFRYRIIDPDKALPLVERKNKPYLIDQESGKTLGVPSGAKVGPLRQTVRYGKPKQDRVYFILFGNPGGFVKPGKKVTVVIGDFRVEDLVVE